MEAREAWDQLATDPGQLGWGCPSRPGPAPRMQATDPGKGTHLASPGQPWPSGSPSLACVGGIKGPSDLQF